MWRGSIDEALVEAIQKAAKEAAEKGVTITVKIRETGFFSSESLDITITAMPPKKG